MSRASDLTTNLVRPGAGSAHDIALALLVTCEFENGRVWKRIDFRRRLRPMECPLT